MTETSQFQFGDKSTTMTKPSNDWADCPAPRVPFTPTTTQVRDAYVRAMRNAFIASASEHEAEFDRWLETVTRVLEAPIPVPRPERDDDA